MADTFAYLDVPNDPSDVIAAAGIGKDSMASDYAKSCSLRLGVTGSEFIDVLEIGSLVFATRACRF